MMLHSRTTSRHWFSKFSNAYSLCVLFDQDEYAEIRSYYNDAEHAMGQ